MSNYNPFHSWDDDLHHDGRPRITFSRTELLHLVASVAALTLAITLARNGLKVPTFSADLGVQVLAALLAVGTGFVLHELAHKVLAQRYGHWAEFRAYFAGLGMTLLVAAFTGVLFAAPGAVLIQGRVTPRENGLISLVGPATNLLLALVAWPFAWAVDADALVPTVAGMVAQINAFLCLFNLVPFGPLDGRKVLRWSKLAYTGSVVVALAAWGTLLVWPNGF